MRTFNYDQLTNIKWDSEILSLVAKIHEYKGKQDLYIRQKPIEYDFFYLRNLGISWINVLCIRQKTAFSN